MRLIFNFILPQNLSKNVFIVKMEAKNDPQNIQLVRAFAIFLSLLRSSTNCVLFDTLMKTEKVV